MKKAYTLFLLLVSFCSLYAQTPETFSTDRTRVRLDSIAKIQSSLNQKITLETSTVTLADLSRYIAKASGVNLNMIGGAEITISCNFTNAVVSDLIHMICRDYNFDFEASGSVISLFAKPQAVKQLAVSFDSINQKLSYDLQNDTLISVVKKISELSHINIIVPVELHNTPISGFANQLNVTNAVKALAGSNNLILNKDKNYNIWHILKDNKKSELNNYFIDENLNIDSLGLITIQSQNLNIPDAVNYLCNKLKLNKHFVTPIDLQVPVNVADVTFDSFLYTVFSGTSYSFYKDNDVYLFGTNTKENPTALSKVINLQYRSVEKIDSYIPLALKNGVEVVKLIELNSLIITGNSSAVSRIEEFIGSVDISVPLVSIDIIIIDSQKSRKKEAGIDIGFGQSPVASSGSIGSSGIDITLGGSSVNSLLNRLNGFGSINLGRVNENFYMSLKFLEGNGDIVLRSTPKLSTLNGNEANLKSGEKKYYKEVTNSIISSQTPIQNESYVWKSVEANLEIKITPFVSRDKQITLDILIEQTEFTEREEKNAPPGSRSRSFKSQIKVGNEDMVLLGGIDKNISEKSSSGLPLLSRIPVLKWIFGSSKNNRSTQKFSVLIKPTIIE